MQSDPAAIDRYLRLLELTPGRITRASHGCEPAQLLFKPAGEDWCANDILAHLRACADVWGGSIQAMINQDHPSFRYISPRTYIRKKDYPRQEFHASLDTFARQRGELLASLSGLELSAWERGAAFTEKDKVREETVFSYAKRIVEHEIVHCEQIEGLLRCA